MEFAILATGSRGNSLVVRCAEGALLVDAGLSGKEILRRLAHFGVRATDIRGLLLSHGHTDHVRGAGVLARRHGWPIVGTRETLTRVGGRGLNGATPREIAPEDHFRMGGFAVRAYSTPHDADGSVQYVIRTNGHVLTIATDIGEETPAVRTAISDAGAVLLESNHDADMLRTGPYPTFLKRRISGPGGHLSNDAAGALLAGMGSKMPRLIVLGHLSDVNNRPDVARKAVDDALSEAEVCPDELDVVPQSVMRGWYTVPKRNDNQGAP